MFEFSFTDEMVKLSNPVVVAIYFVDTIYGYFFIIARLLE